MEVEASIPDVSLRNLRTLVEAGLHVAVLMVVEQGHVLVVFTTGETYLATGFAVGEESECSAAMAKFASQTFGRSVREWYLSLSDGGIWPAHCRGIIDPNMLPGAAPRVFDPESEN